jgi:cobalt/nickel transport system permease protein
MIELGVERTRNGTAWRGIWNSGGGAAVGAGEPRRSRFGGTNPAGLPLCETTALARRIFRTHQRDGRGRVVTSARTALLAYLGSLVAVSFVHHPVMLAGLLLTAVVAAGARRWQILRKTLFAVLAFNLTVSLGYLAVAYWQGLFSADYLLTINLRVILMVFLGFWFVARGDLLAALAGWPLACLVATLAIGQIKTFERILRDFRLAFTSRNLIRPRLLDRHHQSAAQAVTMLDKSLTAAGDAALAMRSRGAFDE